MKIDIIGGKYFYSFDAFHNNTKARLVITEFVPISLFYTRAY